MYDSYFSITNGQPRKPALCQFYRHSFAPYMYAYRCSHPMRCMGRAPSNFGYYCKPRAPLPKKENRTEGKRTSLLLPTECIYPVAKAVCVRGYTSPRTHSSIQVQGPYSLAYWAYDSFFWRTPVVRPPYDMRGYSRRTSYVRRPCAGRKFGRRGVPMRGGGGGFNPN